MPEDWTRPFPDVLTLLVSRTLCPHHPILAPPFAITPTLKSKEIDCVEARVRTAFRRLIRFSELSKSSCRVDTEMRRKVEMDFFTLSQWWTLKATWNDYTVRHLRWFISKIYDIYQAKWFEWWMEEIREIAEPESPGPPNSNNCALFTIFFIRFPCSGCRDMVLLLQ